MERFDIAIIGTGPAGISAAITSKIRNKKILLIGNSDISKKVKIAEKINNYPGLPKISGKEFSAKLKEHLDTMNISVTADRVSTIYAMGNYFVIQAENNLYESKAVILATGMTMSKILPNEEKYLGKGVSYCATCDAPLYKGKTVIVISFSKNGEEDANFLSEISKKVIYIPVYKGESKLNNNIEIKKEIPLEIIGNLNADGIKTKNGKITADGIFIFRESISPQNLVPGLKTYNSRVIVDIDMRTNINGLFACGDITGKPFQYVKAAGQGNSAALSAVSFLDRQK